jgi:curved DNA-binding protein CbpA
MAVRRDANWPRRDHYTVLVVEPSASARQITSAYRRLVRALHPDAHPARPAAQEQFAEVLEAYAALHDPARRAAYDVERKRDSRGAMGGRPIQVKVTRTPGASTGWSGPAGRRRDLVDMGLFDGGVGLFRHPASLEGVLLRVGPAVLHPDHREAQAMFRLGGWGRAWFRRTGRWL